MNYEGRCFSILAAFVLVSLYGNSALLAVAPCRPTGINPDICINGLTGKVEYSLPTAARPGTTVTVAVCPADFIHYDFTVTKADEALKEATILVGIEPPTPKGTAGSTLSLAIVPEETRNSILNSMAMKSREHELLQAYVDLREKIKNELPQVNKVVASVNNAFIGAIFPSDCSAWPSQVAALAGDPGTVPPFFANYDQETRRVSDLEDQRQKLGAQLDDIKLAVTTKSLSLKSEDVVAPDFLTGLITAVAKLQTPIANMQSALDDARKTVGGWSRVIALHPQPMLVQSYLMPQLSTRFTISVLRKPVPPPTQNEADSNAVTTKIEPSVIAVTSFESHAFAHFNISLGMTGTWRNDDRDFDIVPSTDAAGNISFHVREIHRTASAFDAAAFLGLYLNPQGVDQFGPRGRAWMLMIGSEISSSPKNFFLGLGVDSKQGVIFGFGVTEYEGVRLANGWRVGQEIAATADHKPVLSTVGKVRKDTIGGYLFLGFRPSIFRAFLDSRKPS